MNALLIIILIAGVIFIDVYLRTKKLSRKLRFFEQQIPAFRLGGSFMRYNLSGIHAGTPFSIIVTPGGNKSRPKIAVSCRKENPLKILIMKDDSQSDFFTRLSHRPILCSIVKTGDPAFDTRFSIYSHNGADVPAYFYNTNRKNAAAKIFELGYTLLEFKGRRISCQMYDYSVENDLKPEALKAAMECVSVLSRGF
jgi:hypothetical protein